MTFSELDQRIRAALPQDTPERRDILQGLHTLEEGVNLTANFYLNSSGHKLQADGSWLKTDASTPFQVNP